MKPPLAPHAGAPGAGALASPKVLGWMTLVGCLAYLGVAWSKNFELLDNDTLSQLFAWRLLLHGQLLSTWSIATPKFLQIILDGPIADLFGHWAVVARSVVVSFVAASLGALLVKRYWGDWPAVLTFCLLMLNRSVFLLTLSANSTALFSALLIGAAWLWARGSKPAYVVLVLALAATCRIEGICFLAAAGAAYGFRWWRSSERRFLLAMALAVFCAVLAFGLDTIAPSLLSGRFRTNAEITKMIDESATRRAARNLTRGDDLGYDLQRYAAVSASYSSVVSSLVPRIFRPWPLYLLGSIVGIAMYRRRSPALVTVLVAFAAIPLIYCGVLHHLGYALFDRFFLPMVFPTVVLTVGAVKGLSEKMPRLAAWGAGAVALILLAVNARDVFYSERGYLSEVSQIRKELRIALNEVRSRNFVDADLVLPENLWLPANLALPKLV